MVLNENNTFSAGELQTLRIPMFRRPDTIKVHLGDAGVLQLCYTTAENFQVWAAAHLRPTFKLFQTFQNYVENPDFPSTSQLS